MLGQSMRMEHAKTITAVHQSDDRRVRRRPFAGDPSSRMNIKLTSSAKEIEDGASGARSRFPSKPAVCQPRVRGQLGVVELGEA
jgi:hypothetical protein